MSKAWEGPGDGSTDTVVGGEAGRGGVAGPCWSNGRELSGGVVANDFDVDKLDLVDRTAFAVLSELFMT